MKINPPIHIFETGKGCLEIVYHPSLNMRLCLLCHIVLCQQNVHSMKGVSLSTPPPYKNFCVCIMKCVSQSSPPPKRGYLCVSACCLAHYATFFYPYNGGGPDSLGGRGGGASEAPSKKSMKELCWTPGCYIEVVKIELTCYLQKIGSKSQKLIKILRFKNLVRWRFRLGLTHKKSQNSLNFEDRELIFWIQLNFYVFKNHVLQCKLSDQVFYDPIFHTPLLQGVG